MEKYLVKPTLTFLFAVASAETRMIHVAANRSCLGNKIKNAIVKRYSLVRFNVLAILKLIQKR